MLAITSQQENKNENHNEISSHHCQNAYCKKQKNTKAAKPQEQLLLSTEMTLPVLVGMLLSAAMAEDSMKIS